MATFLSCQPRLDPVNFLVNPAADRFQVPWCSKGAFLLSLVEAHAIAGLFKGPSVVFSGHQCALHFFIPREFSLDPPSPPGGFSKGPGGATYWVFISILGHKA